MSKERYLNCKYLDAGMDGMLCSMDLCTTCKEFKGEKCSYYMPKNKSKDKEKQIVELMKDKEFVKLVKLIDNTHPFYVETIALRVYEKYQPKLPEDSVVLSKEEYSDYLILQQNHEFIREKAKELQADNERLYKNIGKFKEIVRKETAEKILNEVAITIKTQSVNDYNFDDKVIEEPILLEKLKEIATREGVEIKE